MLIVRRYFEESINQLIRGQFSLVVLCQVHTQLHYYCTTALYHDYFVLSLLFRYCNTSTGISDAIVMAVHMNLLTTQHV